MLKDSHNIGWLQWKMLDAHLCQGPASSLVTSWAPHPVISRCLRAGIACQTSHVSVSSPDAGLAFANASPSDLSSDLQNGALLFHASSGTFSSGGQAEQIVPGG